MNTENNKLIAEFRGLVLENGAWLSVDTINCMKTFVAREDELKYDTDWNDLMPVVEQIEAELPDDFVVTISYKDCVIPCDEFDIQEIGQTKLEAVYCAVVEYIKWKNDK